jgi:hypothetical protein
VSRKRWPRNLEVFARYWKQDRKRGNTFGVNTFPNSFCTILCISLTLDVQTACWPTAAWQPRIFRRVTSTAKSDYFLRHATVRLSICLSIYPVCVCLSVLSLSAWNNSAPTGRIFMKFNIRVLPENLSRKFKFLSNMTNTSTLHEDVR